MTKLDIRSALKAPFANRMRTSSAADGGHPMLANISTMFRRLSVCQCARSLAPTPPISKSHLTPLMPHRTVGVVPARLSAP